MTASTAAADTQVEPQRENEEAEPPARELEIEDPDEIPPGDVALYNRLTMGREVELRCAGKVSAVGAGWTTNRDGDLDAIVGEKAVKVETVWVLEPEQL